MEQGDGGVRWEWWRDREMMRWVWWDWESARRIQRCGENSSDLSGRLGASRVGPGSVLLVCPVPWTCPLEDGGRWLVSVGEAGLEGAGMWGSDFFLFCSYLAL